MKNNVLICVPPGAIQEDVIATVNDVHPNPTLHIAATSREVPALLDQHSGWAWAVLDLPNDALCESALRDALVRNDALPVILGEEITEDSFRGWVFLDPPFTTDMLRVALNRTRPY